MIFTGHVTGITETTFFVTVKPDDGGPDEIWEVYKNKVPVEEMECVAPGAFFKVSVTGVGVEWTFNKECWTQEMLDEASKEAKRLFEVFSGNQADQSKVEEIRQDAV